MKLFLLASSLNAAAIAISFDKRAGLGNSKFYANGNHPKVNSALKNRKAAAANYKPIAYCKGLLGTKYWTSDADGCKCKQKCTYHYYKGNFPGF